jgi:tetratricopeptide (TPR) repeat protein
MRLALTFIAVLLVGVPASAQDAQAFFGEGLKELREARFELAEEALQRAVTLDPSLGSAYYDLGVCYFADGQFDDAQKAFERALRLSPGNRFAQYYLARISLLQNHAPKAILGFEGLIHEGPVADEFYYLGSAYWHEGNVPAAIRNLTKAAELKSKDSRVHYLLARIYRHVGNAAGAEQELQLSTRLRSDSQKDAQQINRCASTLRSLPTDKAIDECRRELDGADPVKLVSLGALLAEAGALEAAVGPLIRATHLDPDDYESRFDLGLVDMHLKRYSEAKEALGAAVSLQPESFEALALLGSALFSLGEDLAAVDKLRSAHRLQPGNEKVIGLLVSECQIIGSHELVLGNYSQAATYLDNASELLPGSAQIQALAFRLASDAFEHADYETAIRALKLTNQSMQTSSQYHGILGYSSYKRGDAATAVLELQRAMDLDSKNQDYVLQLSEVFIAYNNSEASRTLLEAATRAFPQSAKLWFALGVSYIAADRLEDGKAALNRSHQLDPRLDLVYVVLGQAYRNAGRWTALAGVAEELMQTTPTNYLGYFYNAVALSRQTDSNPDQIQKLLERSSILDADDPEPHYELAKLYARKGEKETAVQELEKITKEDTHFARAYYQLYRLYAQRGDTEKSAEAEKIYEQLRKERGQASLKLLVQIRER